MSHWIIQLIDSKWPIHSVTKQVIHWIMNKVCNYSTYSFFTGRLLSWLGSVQCSSDCGGRAKGSVCLCTQNSSALISISAICSVAAMSVKHKVTVSQCINHLTGSQKPFRCNRRLKRNKKSWCKANIDEVDFKETFFVLLEVNIFNIRTKVILGWKDSII